MTSRNSLSHDKFTKTRQQERQQERQKQLQAQQDQQVRARVDGILINAVSLIYSGLVAKEWDGTETDIPRDVLLRLAITAKNAANILGESLGMLNPPNIQVVEIPPTSEVVEIPTTHEEVAETPPTHEEVAEISAFSVATSESEGEVPIKNG